MKKILSLMLATAVSSMAFALQKTVSCGEQVTIKAVAKTHCHFVKWSDGDTNLQRTVTVDEAKTLTAIFAQDAQYTLTLAANNAKLGSVIITSGEAAAYYAGDQVTIKAVPADNCQQFLYWADDHTNKNATRTIEFANKNLSYTAVFGTMEYNLVIQSEDETMGTVEFVP